MLLVRVRSCRTRIAICGLSTSRRPVFGALTLSVLPVFAGRACHGGGVAGAVVVVLRVSALAYGHAGLIAVSRTHTVGSGSRRGPMDP